MPREVHSVNVTEIGVGYSPRRDRLDDSHVCALLEVIDQLPPIIVDKDTMTLIDGMHRLEAYRRAARTVIPAILFSGDETEALACAIRANVGHGKPLTLGERQTAAATLLSRCPERSDRWIAQVCALSHSTVRAIRKAVAATTVPIRVGRDGRSRAVSLPAIPDGNAPRDATHALDLHQDRRDTGPERASEVASSPYPTPPAAALGQSVGQSLNDRIAGAHPAERSRALLPSRSGEFDWFERTAIPENELGHLVDHVPSIRVPKVVEECRRRARLWNEIAEALERRTIENREPHQTCQTSESIARP